jgi:YegS/Rv2252/BmrU family lipid kinase
MPEIPELSAMKTSTSPSPIAPPTTDEIWVFANPIAGRGVGAKIANELERLFASQGLGVHKFLEKPCDLRDNDLREPARAAIVIGGDGTLRGVAERLLQAGSVPPLLPVPLGTANLMGRHLGIRWDRETVIQQVSQAVSAGKTRYLDAGRANNQLFLLMAGVGFDAQIVYHLDRMRSGPIQVWDYILPTALSLITPPVWPLRVSLDGREIFPQQSGMVFVGNLSEYATGFPVLPYARADDGLLDVCVLPCKSHVDLVRLFLLAAAGEHVQSEGVVYQRGKHVEIDSPGQIMVQVDGDPAGYTPVRIDLLPTQLPFIVP